MSLPDALEAAAGALPAEADAIRPANGDAARLLGALAPEGAARVAAWLFAHRAADAEELADIWSETPAGQAALFAIGEEALPKDGRKLLRRVLHRLRTRGVATPERPPAPTVARLPEVEEELTGAYVTGLDPMGARQVWWLEPSPGGGTLFFECTIDAGRGVLGFDVYQPTRSDLRRFLRQLGANPAFPVYAVEVATAKALVRHAAERQSGERSAPKRWVEWRARLGAQEGARLPGALAEEALGAPPAEVREALAAAAALVASGRCGPWPPARTALAPLVERVQAALASPLVVSGATRREQLAGLLDEAAGELFSGDGAAVAAHRFGEMAFSFWRAGDEPAARACLAAARAFEHEPAAARPVARAFLEVWLRPLLERADEPAPTDAGAEQGSLLVRP